MTAKLMSEVLGFGCFISPLRGTNMLAILQSEAKGACVFVSQRAPASDYMGLLCDDVLFNFSRRLLYA